MATSHGHSFPPGSLDPYLEWAIENNFRHLRPGQWLPMLVEFRINGRIARGQPTALQTFTQLDWLDAGLKKSVRVPEIFVRPPDAISRSRYFNFCVLLIDKDQAATVTMSAGWRNTIRGMSFSPPLDLPTKAAASTRSSNRKPGLLARIVAFMKQPFGRWMVLTPVRRQAGAVLPFESIGSLSKHLGVIPPSNAGGPAPTPPVPGATPVSTPPGVVSPGPIGGGARVPAPAGGRVAIAVLDEGIAFAHSAFSIARRTADSVPVESERSSCQCTRQRDARKRVDGGRDRECNERCDGERTGRRRRRLPCRRWLALRRRGVQGARPSPLARHACNEPCGGVECWRGACKPADYRGGVAGSGGRRSCGNAVRRLHFFRRGLRTRACADARRRWKPTCRVQHQLWAASRLP